MNKSEFSEISARVLDRKKKKQKEQKKEELQKKEQVQYERKNWKNIAWEKLPIETYEYAIWYYYKLFKLYNISLIFAIPGFIFLLLAYKESNWDIYFQAGFFVGLAKAIANEGGAESYYDKDNIFEFPWYGRIIWGFYSFVGGFFFSPLILIHYFVRYIHLFRNRKNPPPPPSSPESSDSDWSPTHIAKIDKDGNVWKY